MTGGIRWDGIRCDQEAQPCGGCFRNAGYSDTPRGTGVLLEDQQTTYVRERPARKVTDPRKAAKLSSISKLKNRRLVAEAAVKRLLFVDVALVGIFRRGAEKGNA